jgi:phosphate/sulfate permease
MIMGIAALVFIPLLAIAMAYFVWSLGRTWPIRDEELLARTVTGRAGVEKMPPRWTSFLVAVFMIAAGIVALSLADDSAGGWGLNLAGAALGALFLARGIAGYTPAWRAQFSAEPFATLDRRNYSPLALWLGAGFLLLVLLRLT